MLPLRPPMEIRTCKPERREPGVILFTARPSSINNEKAKLGWVYGLDQQGEVVLEACTEAATQDVRFDARNGTIFFSQAGAGRLIEIDREGREIACWHARGKWRGKPAPQGSIELPVEFLHHTFNILPNGNFLLLSAEARSFDNWHTSSEDRHAPRAPALLVGDVIVEATRQGALVREWHLFDILDPYRISHGSLSGYWRKQGFPGSYAWAHANAIAYDADDDSIVVSLRRQDCMAKFSCETHALKWILGNHENWSERFRPFLLEPKGKLEWPYHQHDCSVIGRGRVMCFDNGNYRAPAFQPSQADESSYSRVVEFAVDEKRGTVEEVWRYGDAGPQRMFVCYQGGGLRLPATGNTFMTFGGICTKDGVPTSENSGAFCTARLLEVTPGGEVVFDLVIDDSGSSEPRPYSAFRADHIPG